VDIVVGHAGHWIAGLVYAGPAIAIAALAGVAYLRERRKVDK
jgi:predicted benzoate:H+ symporter BenE